MPALTTHAGHAPVTENMNRAEIVQLIKYLNQTILPKVQQLERELDIVKQQSRRTKFKKWIDYDDPDL